MLKELSLDQARAVAALANAARVERDELLGNVAEADIETERPGRGEHNPTAGLGFDPLPADTPQFLALRETIGALSTAARRELYAVMRIGQGHLAAKDWERAITEAVGLGEETVAAQFVEDADLHDHIAKGLYEAGLSA